MDHAVGKLTIERMEAQEMIIANLILSVITIACWIFIIIHYVRLGSKYGEVVRDYEKLCDSHEECIKRSLELIVKNHDLEVENDTLKNQIIFLRAKNYKNKEK